MKIIKSYLTKNDCYRVNKKITVKGLMLHSVGVNQPKATVFVNSWNKSGLEKCVHAFLQSDGSVYQTLPWNTRGWHCAKSGNNTHIGVEMCEPSTIKYSGGASFVDNNKTATLKYIKGTYQTAVELFAYLCKEYKLDPLKDIVSHSEGYKKGIASNHADVEHIWKKYGMTMNQFRKDVKAEMEKTDIIYRVGTDWKDGKCIGQIGAYRVLQYAKNACKSGYNVYDPNGKVVFSNKKEEEKPNPTPTPDPTPQPEPTPDPVEEEPNEDKPSNWFSRLINLIVKFIKKIFKIS